MHYVDELTNEQLYAFYAVETDPARKEALRELFFERNYRYVLFFVNKYRNMGMPYPEMVSLAQFGMVKAFNGYKLQKEVKFTSFMQLVVFSELARYYERQHKKRGYVLSLDAEMKANGGEDDVSYYELLAGDAEVEKTQEQSAIMQLINEAAEHLLSPREKIIFKNQLAGGLKAQKELGQELGISQMQVSRLHRGAIAKIRDYLIAHGYTKELVFSDYS